MCTSPVRQTSGKHHKSETRVYFPVATQTHKGNIDRKH